MSEEIIHCGHCDFQTNGVLGIDFSKGELSDSEIKTFFEWQVQHGVTKSFPTFISAPYENIKAAVESFVRVAEADPVSNALLGGFHLECYVSPQDGFRGAHKKDFVRRPALEEITYLQKVAKGRIKIITVDPTNEQGKEGEIFNLVKELSAMGILVSVGHSPASWQDISKFQASGGQLITHWGNGIPASINRHNHVAFSQLYADKLVPMIIVDGFHIPFDSNLWPWLFRAMLRNCFIITTDNCPATGLPPGKHKLGDVVSEVLENGKAVLPGTNQLAGSTTTITEELGNLVRLTRGHPDFSEFSIGKAMRATNVTPLNMADIKYSERLRFNVISEWDDDNFTLNTRQVSFDGEVIFSG